MKTNTNTLKSRRCRELMRSWAQTWRQTKSTFALEMAAGLNRASVEWRRAGNYTKENL